MIKKMIQGENEGEKENQQGFKWGKLASISIEVTNSALLLSISAIFYEVQKEVTANDTIMTTHMPVVPS